MLVLDEKAMLETVSMKDVMEAMKRAYCLYENKQYEMPLRTQLQDNENTFLLMPSIAHQSFSLKIVSVFPNNRQHPVTQGMVILIDRQTGSAKALLNGTVLTGLRTGAIGGLAVDYLSPADVKTVGLIGTGYQGLYQLLAVCTIRSIDRIYLYNRTSSKYPAFIAALKNRLPSEVEIHIAAQPLDLVQQSDIIITATTSSTPVLPDETNIWNGKLIVGIGSYQPHMREFPDALYKNATCIFVDTLDAIKESGDIRYPMERSWLTELQMIAFSKVVTNKVNHTFQSDCPTIFKSTGMALFDLVVAEMMYERAIAKQTGAYVHL
ncbi:ornithine cyclodeaminase family protein [Geobacillus sp. 44B]|jgi:ornithine cyclodeaminase/alanine dehydrogenase-like protein (mu-crystallin family)|nr:ornithine cyclodeaminase [Geobacillus sp. 44B]QNU36716.1 ornithine cyclodeaminase family protein [Geobacillus sp. 44B]